MSEKELLVELEKKRKDFSGLTMKRFFGKMKDQNKLQEAKKEIARINTYLRLRIIKELNGKGAKNENKKPE